MLYMMVSLLLGAAPAPVVLENAAVRIEVDPQLLAVRYLGAPDGPNLVESLHVENRQRRQPEGVDTGGVTWQVTEGGAPLSFGPADVVAHSEQRIVLLTSRNEESHLRLKVEFVLEGESPEVAMRATVTTDEPGSTLPVALRCAFRVRPGALAGSFVAQAPVLYALDKQGPGTPVNQWDGILFDAGAIGSQPLLVSSMGSSVSMERSGYRVMRVLPEGAAPSASYANAKNLHGVSDPRSQTYGIIMESPKAQVGPTSPLVYREVWRIATTD